MSSNNIYFIGTYQHDEDEQYCVYKQGLRNEVSINNDKWNRVTQVP
jgi:hypothetical protein